MDLVRPFTFYFLFLYCLNFTLSVCHVLISKRSKDVSIVKTTKEKKLGQKCASQWGFKMILKYGPFLEGVTN